MSAPGPRTSPEGERCTSVLIGLGSNLGERRALLEQAVERLAAADGVRWIRLSSWRETEPEGGPPQGRYLNGAGELECRLAPLELLDLLQSVEAELGRVRTVRHGPRPIDLDILLFGDLVMEHPRLVVPHPRLCERLFVLEPLAEIVPERLHPLSGRSLRDHFEELRGKPCA
jgi:2-amino-4-hydroxy-6-hydroxymethyldihydropteridine diphosphokinase